MELTIIGIEGSWWQDCQLTWGAAAIRKGDEVLNSITRRWDMYHPDLPIIHFDEPIPLEEKYEESKLIMLGLRGEMVNEEALYPTDSYAIIQSFQNNGKFYAFENQEQFNEYRKTAIENVFQKALLGEWNREQALAILPLCPLDPYLLAIFAANPSPYQRQNGFRVENCIPVPEHKPVFREALNRLLESRDN